MDKTKGYARFDIFANIVIEETTVYKNIGIFLKNVMDKSGAKIEMSSSKDQTLTFLITGSEAAYLKAKSELTQAFQVLSLF